jgi:hypothetical protein
LESAHVGGQALTAKPGTRWLSCQAAALAALRIWLQIDDDSARIVRQKMECIMLRPYGMSYLQTTDIEHPRLAIPHDFDVAVAKATVAALAAWTGRPVEFADEQTIQIALSLVDAATAARIRTWIGNDKNKELAFFRHLPKNMYSKHAEFGGLAVVVERIRGLKPKKASTEFTLHPGYAAHFTDAEITQMAQLFSSDLTQQWWVYDAVAARRLVHAIVDDNALLQFWQKYQGDEWLCLREMSDPQVAVLQRWGWQQKSAGTRPPKDRMVMFEVCRRGQLTKDELTQTCQWLSTTVDRFYQPIRLLDVPRAATEVARDPTANDVLVALVHVFAQLSKFALPLRQWIQTATSSFVRACCCYGP